MALPEFSDEDLETAGVIAAAVLALLLVALSTYSRRRCCHPAVRIVVLGISIAYLPLISYIISCLRKKSTEKNCMDGEPLIPEGGNNAVARNMWTLLLWIVLILIIRGNADTAAEGVRATSAMPSSGDVSIDGQRISPSVAHLVQYAWVANLIWLCLPQAKWVGRTNLAIFIVFTAVGLSKMVLKLAASFFAGRSFALGKNARLISGYMAQLTADGDDGYKPVPPYIVMGETKKYVDQSPQEYRVKQDVLDDEFSGLVTLDRVWQLAEPGNGILAEQPKLRDLCLSYSLFKILRRRLSGYPLADAGSNQSLEFVLRGMDSAGAGGADDADRVFRVLVDELWFASDFYYSTVPLCALSMWCAALNCLFSVLIIAGAVTVGCIFHDKKVINTTNPFYQIVSYSLLAIVMLLEAWEIIACICSNWAKMALLGHYIRRKSAVCRGFSCCADAVLGVVLRLRPASRWRDKIGQNSVLEPRRFHRWTAAIFPRKLYGNLGLLKSVDVSPGVKDAVLRSLLSSYGRLRKGDAAAQRVGGKVDWALYGAQKSCAWGGGSDGSCRSNTELILMWHVATRLFEMKFTSASADMITASHLSYYCAYLVAAAPELLPDNAAWTKKRYDEVSKHVRVVLAADGGSESMEGRYEWLAAALSARERDKVLRQGAKLGRHLVEEYGEGEASACRILSDFWSEMMLFIAPSENVKGHVEAMARGGEFITLVWALLLHAGVTTRPDMPAGASP